VLSLQTCPPGEEGKRTRSAAGKSSRKGTRSPERRPPETAKRSRPSVEDEAVADDPVEGEVLGYFITIPGKAPRWVCSLIAANANLSHLVVFFYDTAATANLFSLQVIPQYIATTARCRHLWLLLCDTGAKTICLV